MSRVARQTRETGCLKGDIPRLLLEAAAGQRDREGWDGQGTQGDGAEEEGGGGR